MAMVCEDRTDRIDRDGNESKALPEWLIPNVTGQSVAISMELLDPHNSNAATPP
jgi:hypothetical protein